MSQTQADSLANQAATEGDDHDDKVKITIEDEDLEDGEIDDSDDDEESKDPDVVIISSTTSDEANNANNSNTSTAKANNSKLLLASNHESVVTVIDSSSDTASTPPPTTTATANNSTTLKSKKPTPLEDDHASSIENAIAMALKKKGIEPSIPKILENKLQHEGDDKDESGAGGSLSGQGQSKSSRRRKRKKQREEKEKERKIKKKRYDSPDPLGPPPLEDDDDMDEYEMLNVRGGSPPPLSALPPSSSAHLQSNNMHMYKDQYNSDDDSASSYDSYDSDGNDSNVGGERSRRKRRKESRKRKEKRQRDDDKRYEKRSRRDSLDHRNEPRKLELCKFYLMECCAKKDKCSYMHSDFPCKFYYLGMECQQKEDCKFSHDKPLSEELRNILLKHLETAPKEILGNFKRLSRENALAMVTKRHEELCRQFNVQNVWAPCSASSLPIHNNRRNNNMNNKNNNEQQMQQQHHKQQQQQQQQQPNTNNSSGIPSLLDLVVNPPPNMELNKSNNHENKRKSRWADNSNAKTSNAGNQISIQPPSKMAPSYLDLKNLHGILSAEHIDRLQQLGIVNLEQVNQLTFGQLNQIGLTIAEITEIQLNAMNMAKLGVTTAGGGGGGVAVSVKATSSVCTTSSSISKTNSISKENSSSNGDVDMRFLPSTSTSSANASDVAVTESTEPDKDLATSSSSSNSSSGVVMVDYTQYLKDSNLSFDRGGDIYDDEKDEEKLVIDDDNTDTEEQQNQKSSNTDITLAQEQQLQQQQHEQQEKTAYDSYDNGFSSKLSSMTNITQTFRNPFKTNSFYGSDKNDLTTANRLERSSPPKVTDRDYDEGNNESVGFYSTSRRRYSRESRSRSRTPTRSQSNTPEASQSPQPLQLIVEGGDDRAIEDVVYERPTMYDFSTRFAEEDEQRALKTKMDKDMRFLPGGLGSDASASDIDLRLPFQPMTNYTPATEIDGSITSHLPISYKVYEVDVARPSYAELRQHFKSDHATDPRLRRILGLPELSQTKTSAALSRKVRKTSHSSSIASPSESEGSSPKYYTPPSSTEERLRSHRLDPRERERGGDPRTDPRSDPRSDPRRQDPRHNANTSGAASSNTSSTITTLNATGGQKQNIEIRNLLQKSEWYKNLNSKFKIMVNQQLALVSTELKKFHQDTSPNKIFDISFIVNNQTLQQILTNLGIFIDDNGEVAHIDNDNEELDDGEGQQQTGLVGSSGNLKSNLNLPNLSQPPPNVGNMPGNNAAAAAMEFLRAPPPNLVAQGPSSIVLGPMFQRPIMQAFNRPSLLGLPPGAQGNPLNPFANPMNINPNFLAGGPNILGPFGPNFGPNMGGNMSLNMQQQQQMRNFNNNQRNNQRNQNRRKI